MTATEYLALTPDDRATWYATATYADLAALRQAALDAGPDSLTHREISHAVNEARTAWYAARRRELHEIADATLAAEDRARD